MTENTDYRLIGPAIGEVFPDFELPDADGKPVRLHGWRAGQLERRGIGLIGVSYDPPAVLREFATARGISFPLLADEGSRVITGLGLLDRDLAEHHTRFGVPTRESARVHIA